MIFFLTALVSKNYRDILQRNKWVELGKVFTQVVFTFVAFILYLYIINENDFSRRIYLVTALISFVLMWCWRVFWKHVIRLRMARNNNLPQMLIICDGEDVEELVPSIKQKQYDYFRVLGVVIYGEDSHNTGEVITDKPMRKGNAGSGGVDHTPVVCAPDELKEYLLGGIVDEVFISLSDEKEEQDIINYCLEMGIIVHMGLAGAGMDYPNAMVGRIGVNTVLTTSINVTDYWRLFVKRVVDIIGGLFGCLIMFIMYLIIAPKIRKADPGPVFFKQPRVGRNGRIFNIYKFRSMYMDAESRKAELMQQNEMSGRIFKMKNDPRILPGIGEKIRKSSIDEWPQFINVLKGDMSLVGTRPPTVDEYEQYEPHHKARLSFRPGITGLWQVSGRSRITDFERIVELDDTYIREWSLLLDAKILVKTVGVVLKHEGAE